MMARIMLALLVVVPAAMSYPWHSLPHKWIGGIAVAVVVLLFARWRGMFLSTMVAQRFAVWCRNRAGTPSVPADRVTVVLRVQSEDGFPYGTLPLVAGYVHRYGIRCDSVRVTERQLDDTRAAWLSVTVAAAPNLAALQARSADLPLADTAQKVARRLADQLREAGVQVTVVDDAPAPVQAGARETWRAVRDGDGFVTAYGLPMDHRLPGCLAELASSTELWTVLEFSNHATNSAVAAACAVRTVNVPTAAAIPGLMRESGRQGPLLAAMAPASAGGLGTPAGALIPTLLADLAGLRPVPAEAAVS
ncbi:MAG: type VII secretion protein EccE [Mycobacterium sp.]|nr:type VII secretion protein EccE [Mycobacterium sp.]